MDILERGDIFFLYRPRVGPADASPRVIAGLTDVQSTFIVLAPHGRDVSRRIAVGRKRLPEPREKHWGYVDRVGPRYAARDPELEPTTYSTTTRGERLQPGARAAGEGVYALAVHGDHTHLAYVLELPRELGVVQHDLGIVGEASYIIAVRDPTGARRWVKADPALLDREGIDLVLIGIEDDVPSELGVELAPQQETVATADVLAQLRLYGEGHPITPLVGGEWA